jgi:hypothetical protein
MGIWIILAIQVILSAAILVGVALALAWARSAAKNGQKALDLVESLAAVFRKGHGYPNQAPVAQGEAADHGDSGAAVPATAEPLKVPALAPVERRVVTVTRDDHPDHTRPTREAPPPDTLAREKRAIRARVEAQEDARNANRTAMPDVFAPLTPTEPSAVHGPEALSQNGKIERRYRALCATSEELAEHCHGPECFRNGDADTTTGCACECEPCNRALDLYLQAHRDVTGREPAITYAHVRVKVGPVVFKDERSVTFTVGETAYALLAPASDVNGNMLRVEVIGVVGEKVWIDLPAIPVGCQSRRVSLPKTLVILK